MGPLDVMKEVKCATKAFIMYDGELLVIKQKMRNKEFWDMPGGRMEFGLTLEENLKKEVKEEVCIEIEIEKLIGTSQFVNHNGDQVVCLNYLCRPKSKNVDITKNPVDDENIVKFEWIKPKEFFAQLGEDQAGLKNFVKYHFL